LAVNLSKEVSRKMRDTASETLALPIEEAASSSAYNPRSAIHNLYNSRPLTFIRGTIPSSSPLPQ
jgi:hypothetical protein